MTYEPTIWKTGDIITADKLNKIENSVVELSEEYYNKLITIFKTSETILLEWIGSSGAYQIRFYGSTVDYVASDRHGTTTIAGTTIDWVIHRYLCLDFTIESQPNIKYFDNLDDIYANDKFYIFGFMQYLNGVENVTIINNVSIPKPTNLEE